MDKKALLLSILVMLVFDFTFLSLGILNVDIPGTVSSLLITDVIGVGMLYMAMTFD